jgi:hypothetical protein
MAPEAGFEPATWGLTVPRSTAELLRINRLIIRDTPSDGQTSELTDSSSSG